LHAILIVIHTVKAPNIVYSNMSVARFQLKHGNWG